MQANVGVIHRAKKSIESHLLNHAVAGCSMIDDFFSSTDDSFASLEEAIASNGDRETIVALMQHDIHREIHGSRRNRRKQRSRPAKKNATRLSEEGEGVVTSRRGRPTIGNEVRVRLQTCVAQKTSENLAKHGVTLAEIFDSCARGLASHGS